MKTFRQASKGCKSKMWIVTNGVKNCECAINRKIIAGLGGCLCRSGNCVHMTVQRTRRPTKGEEQKEGKV